MKTLNELQEERDRLKAELIEVEKSICRHPEHIRLMFCHNPFWKLDRFEELVGRVEFARKLTPGVDKTGDMWHPFVYQMGGQNYNVRFSESSLAMNCDTEAALGDRAEYDGYMADELWNAEDPVQWLEDHGVTEDFKKIGYLMYLTMREDTTKKE